MCVILELGSIWQRAETMEGDKKKLTNISGHKVNYICMIVAALDIQNPKPKEKSWNCKTMFQRNMHEKKRHKNENQDLMIVKEIEQDDDPRRND